MFDIDVVVFDWYATLAAPSVADFWPRLPELITDAGGVVDAEALDEWERGHPLAHLEHSSSEAAYRQFQRRRFEQLLARCSLSEPARIRLAAEVGRERYGRDFEVFDGVVEALGALRHRSYRIGVCSNWDWDLDRHLRANGVDVLVDFVVCSAVVGYRKPHPAIFDLVLAGAGAPPERILFVGDNWDDDIGGASRAGMHVLHVATGTSCATLDHGPVPCAASIAEVVELIERPPNLGDPAPALRPDRDRP